MGVCIAVVFASVVAYDLRDISSMGNHTIAISMIGTVYTWGNGGSGRLGLNNTDTVPYRLGMIEDNTGTSDKSESDGIVSPDSICHYEASKDITKAEYSQYHGRLLKGINRSKLKSKLVYKFSQESSSKYTVYVIYDKNVVLEQFSLYMNTMAELSRRGVILYTPDGSNTTFVAPKLLKILSEVQMKNILIG